MEPFAGVEWSWETLLSGTGGELQKITSPPFLCELTQCFILCA